jgi:peptidoglycan/LPS O-acetylase OafA/YrhL
VVDDGWRLGHRPGLDGLRGIAVLLVLALHWWPAMFPGGNTGVSLFFVLSGFLITRLLIEEVWRDGAVDFRAFYVRRLRRLMPASLALTLLFIATPGAVWVLLYSANWARVDGVLVGGPLEHTWSLAVEEQFYLLWPAVLVGVVLRFGRMAWAATAALAFVVALHRVDLHDSAEAVRLTVGTDTRLDALLIGCAAALAMSALARVGQRTWMIGAAVVAPLFALLVMDLPDMGGWGFTLEAVGWCVVVLWAVGTGSAWISTPTLRWFGRLSYSLYLWHYPVTWALRDGDMHATEWWSTALAIPLSIGAAWLSYRFVESRFRSGVRRCGPRDAPSGRHVVAKEVRVVEGHRA